MRLGYWALEGKEPVYIGQDLARWGAMMNSDDARRVASTRLPDDVHVSTVFLGLDHGWDDSGPPVLFETMIFGGPHDQYQERYCTWDEAEAGHVKAVELAQTEKTDEQ